MKKLRLSQVMIVQNEENNIERALSWGKAYMYEQIVVDTGSTDRTVELASSLGAAVYQFDWIQDFSAAKNFALSKCSGDWIAFLDADEYMECEQAAKLEEMIALCDREGYNLITHPILNLDGHGGVRSVQTQGRFFQNDSRIHYENPIHEVLVCDGGELRSFFAGDTLQVMHTGYTDDALEQKKGSGRNIELIQSALETNPADPVLLSYLGDAYFTEGQFVDAKSCYENAIDLYKSSHRVPDQRLALDYAGLLQAYVNLGKDEKDVLRLYKEAIYRFPKEPDLSFIMGAIAYVQGKFAKAAEYYLEALQKLNAYGHVSQGMMTLGNLLKIYIEAADAMHRSGRNDEAFDLAQEAVKNAPEDMTALSVWLDIMRVWREAGQINESIEINQLGQVYGLDTLKRRLLLIQAANLVEDNWLIEYLKTRFSAEERKLLAENEFWRDFI